MNAQLQHHDAITGTMRWKVLQDYLSSLNTGIQGAYQVASQSLGVFVSKNIDNPPLLKVPQWNNTITVIPGEVSFEYLFFDIRLLL